jgi:hypothetical protein
MGAGDRRVWCEAAEMLVDMVHHLRHPTITEHPLGEGQALIAYAKQALARVAHPGKQRRRATVLLLGLGRYCVESYGTSPELCKV